MNDESCLEGAYRLVIGILGEEEGEAISKESLALVWIEIEGGLNIPVQKYGT